MSRSLRLAALLCALLGAAQLGLAGYIPAKAWLAQQLLERAWAAARAEQSAVRPWPWADTYPVARLRQPERGVDLIVLAGSSGQALAFGPGHLGVSAAPGAAGNTVITGHRDTHFAFLRSLQPGETVTLTGRDGRSRAYRVRATQVVDARVSRLALDAERPTLTLVTCYPFDAVLPGGPLRYVVTAVADADPAGG